VSARSPGRGRNVTAHLVAKAATGTNIRSSARLAAGIVGYRIPEIRPAQVVGLRPGDLIVIATDGITKIIWITLTSPLGHCYSR